jgi:hypothetical protein
MTLRKREVQTMDKRARLILTRAKELLVRDDPTAGWVEIPDGHDTRTIERQAACLSLAEHQLLAEQRIESVDQS